MYEVQRLLRKDGGPMKRDDYEKLKPNSLGISTKNEPLEDNVLTVNTRAYPDMYKAYADFSKAYGIPLGNFILTNGCESALRIALLALRPDKLTIEQPTWARVQVECEALDIDYDCIDYRYYDGIFYPEREVSPGFLYTTDTYNNLFRHENIKNRGITIMDETYTSRSLFAERKEFRSDKIVIGSFSKTGGAGLRLGYCIFSDCWSERFNLLREQYISPAACEWLATSSIPLQFVDDTKIPYRIVTQHPVYTTVEAKSLPIPHKHFKVSGIDFCRFGTKYDMTDLVRELSHEHSI